MKIIILLGKSGCGKGTQAKLLKKKLGFVHISTGVLLRARMKKNDYLGRGIADILKRGGLVPTPIVFHMWLHELDRLQKKTNCKGIILEGSPRKLYEAWMLQEALQFYGWEKDTRAVDIKISDKEALRRLLLRKRADDETKAIKERLSWFPKEVQPAIDFYKKNHMLMEVNGEQSVEGVQKEILLKLKKFLQ